MNASAIRGAIGDLVLRQLPDGGFPEYAHSVYRPDSTSLAIIALHSAGRPNIDKIETARTRLAESQLSDGRVPMSSSSPAVFWPTSLAVLAWLGSPRHQEPLALAIDFLLTAGGRTIDETKNPAGLINGAIQGWSWIENTFSWVEPTALALLALGTAGFRDHARYREGIRLLLDRQLPHGGWNYGNTVLYGQELLPQTDMTGMALSTLAGEVEKRRVENSLRYLEGRASLVRTPFSLAWALIGLAAWDKRPKNAEKWIFESLDLQEKQGQYSTSLLCLLIIASFPARGIPALIRNREVVE